MSDFETRLTGALTSGAQEAPTVDRLADGARTRARARRRTRAALVAAGVVVALAVPVGVVAFVAGDAGSGGGGRVATDGPERAPGGWQTVEHEGALVDVPGEWERLDTSSCEFQWTRYGPADSDPCGFDGEGLSFYGSATFDPATGPGLHDEAGRWQGYVYAGDWAVWAVTAERDSSLRILGSARVEGQAAPDLSTGFRTVSYDGLAIDVPADWREGALSNWCQHESAPGLVQLPDTVVNLSACLEHRLGYGVSFSAQSEDATGMREREGPRYPEGSWAGFAIAPDETGRPLGTVLVVAPTQGLAELIGGSLRMQ